jgi:hypothetical protein
MRFVGVQVSTRNLELLAKYKDFEVRLTALKFDERTKLL